jgi:hypothetical protein
MPSSGFLPGRRRFLSLTLREGVRPESWCFRACLQCGHLWGSIDPDELRHFIDTQCTDATRLRWRLVEKPPDSAIDGLE